MKYFRQTRFLHLVPDRVELGEQHIKFTKRKLIRALNSEYTISLITSSVELLPPTLIQYILRVRTIVIKGSDTYELKNIKRGKELYRQINKLIN